LLASWVMVKTKVAELPRGVNWKHMTGAGILAGIGFTMSIFITCLAFTDTATQDLGKIAILLAAILSILAAVIWFYFTASKKPLMRVVK